MARSHSIYIVRDSHHAIIAAFTVKHECRSFLERRLGGYRFLSVLTQRDGSSDAGKQVTAKEFMA